MKAWRYLQEPVAVERGWVWWVSFAIFAGAITDLLR